MMAARQCECALMPLKVHLEMVQIMGGKNPTAGLQNLRMNVQATLESTLLVVSFGRSMSVSTNNRW